MQDPNHCYYCVNKGDIIDYKLPEALQFYLSHHRKILSRRYSGLCAKHQRKVEQAIKRARTMALLPYVRSK